MYAVTASEKKKGEEGKGVELHLDLSPMKYFLTVSLFSCVRANCLCLVTGCYFVVLFCDLFCMWIASWLEHFWELV